MLNKDKIKEEEERFENPSTETVDRMCKERKDKCIICGISTKDGATLVQSKNKATTCHSHQNYGKDTLPGSHGCGEGCHFKEPYGFVPEAGCMIHDN